MSPRPTAERPRRTGRIRFVASLGVLAFAGVSVTAAAVTDSAVATLSPMGGKFDIAYADSAGTLIPQGQVYAIPDSDISGTIRPLDSGLAGPDASFPLRIVNNSTGSIGAHATVSFQNLAAPGALDIYSKLQLQVIDPADPAHPLVPWTSTTADPAFSIDLDATTRSRTLNVQLRLVASDQLDGRYYGAQLGIGTTLRGESS